MKRLCFVALLFVLLAFPSNARADVAPPYYPPGSNPQPGVETTQVRMVAETVVIEVQKDIAPESLGRAHVSADFTMRNLGSADERMAARFPIGGNDMSGGYPEIGNLVIKINGKQVSYGRIGFHDEYYPNGEIPWAEFEIVFPVGLDVSIHVEYDLQGTGYYPLTAFYYILETGAGWKDTIGSADIILRLPYEASVQNVLLNEEIGWAETTPAGVFQGNEVRWHYDDLEPFDGQNMEFALVAPSAWQNVLTARDNAEKHPNDGESWGMLAKAYKQVLAHYKGNPRRDAGGEELYQLSFEAYEKCVSLKPDDAQWHAGFADLLTNHVTWDRNTRNTDPATYRALNEIRTALELAPNDPVVLEIAQNMTYMLEGGIRKNGEAFDFPWLTQTPTPYPPTLEVIIPEDATPTLSVPPPGTEVVQVAATRTNAPEATPTPAPQKSSPLCGSAALVPGIVMAWFVWKRR